jgi:hypothetical protein
MMKKNWKIKVFLALRKCGMLCKKPKEKNYGLKIRSTVYPPNPVSFTQQQRFTYLNNKKSSYKNCKFDPETEFCECGVTLDNFGERGCNEKNKKQLILG